MTKEELLSIERNLWTEYSKKLNEANAEYLKNSEIQVGDFVKVFWTSRDYGKESANVVVRFLGARTTTKEWMYYFNKINNKGKESKRPFYLPKYSRIYKIVRL